MPRLRPLAERSPKHELPVISYRVEDAARAVGLSRARVFELIRSGELKSVFVAGRRLIPADALRELVQGARKP